MHDGIRDVYQCGECGSEDWEKFNDKFRSGIRCKNCGHEQQNEKPSYRGEKQIAYVWRKNDRIKF